MRVILLLLVAQAISGCARTSYTHPFEALASDDSVDCGTYRNIGPTRKLRQIENCVAKSRIKGKSFVLREEHSGSCAGEYFSNIFIEESGGKVLMYQFSSDEAGIYSQFVGVCIGLKISAEQGIEAVGCHFSDEHWNRYLEST